MQHIYNSIHYLKNDILFYCVDLHGLGALVGGDEALLFSHQSLKGNPCEENRKENVFDLLMLFCFFKQNSLTRTQCYSCPGGMSRWSYSIKDTELCCWPLTEIVSFICTKTTVNAVFEAACGAQKCLPT